MTRLHTGAVLAIAVALGSAGCEKSPPPPPKAGPTAPASGAQAAPLPAGSAPGGTAPSAPSGAAKSADSAKPADGTKPADGMKPADGAKPANAAPAGSAAAPSGSATAPANAAPSDSAAPATSAPGEPAIVRQWSEKWPNGQQKALCPMVRDPKTNKLVKHGVWRSWNEDGSLNKEGRYVFDEQDGDWKFYYPGVDRPIIESFKLGKKLPTPPSR